MKRRVRSPKQGSASGMLDLNDRRTLLLCGAATAGAATVWLARRQLTSSALQASSAPTSFESYLRNKDVGRKAAPPQRFAATSFEAYLRQPSATVAAAAAAPTAAAAAASAPAAPPADAKPVTVLYGTEYGFSREVAERACDALRGAGFWPQLLDMAGLPRGLPALASHQALLVVCSTQGDGVPPTEARDFCEWLAGSGAPQLGGAVRFSVCALGDRWAPAVRYASPGSCRHAVRLASLM